MATRRGTKGADQNPREQVQRAFTERMGSIMLETGIPRMPARVFAALLASDEGRMTAAELGERVKASPAGISGAVRYLGQLGLVARERESGSRRDHFVLHEEVFYELMVQDLKALTRWEHGLKEGIDSLGPDTPAGQRLGETLDFFEFMKAELADVLERWDEQRTQTRT